MTPDKNWDHEPSTWVLLELLGIVDEISFTCYWGEEYKHGILRLPSTFKPTNEITSV
jgi:hypothetical protein